MKVLIFALALTLLGCENREGINQEDPQMFLPTCRVIYIGGCPHVWCRQGHGGGLVSQDPTCRPQNAVVSSSPPTAPQKVCP